MPALGSPHDIRKGMIPEWDRGVGIVKDWCQEFMYQLNPHNVPAFFLTAFVQVTTLSFLLDDAKSTALYLTRSPPLVGRLESLPPWYIHANALEEIAVAIQAISPVSASAAVVNIR